MTTYQPPKITEEVIDDSRWIQRDGKRPFFGDIAVVVAVRLVRLKATRVGELILWFERRTFSLTRRVI